MNQSAFYGVVAAANLTLLGLWWVAVKDRTNLVGHKDAASRRAAYLVSLQFAIPATVALLAQVNPEERAIWRFAFGSAGVVGAIGIALLAQQIWTGTVARISPIAVRAGRHPDLRARGHRGVRPHRWWPTRA